MNTVDDLREIWPRLSADERRLFDVIARSYLAALMPDFRYRQTTALLDVGGHPFRAVGRQPIELGWRAAFGRWQPDEDERARRQAAAAAAPGRRERRGCASPRSRTKETQPPPRYNEGTLIEAMQNAWRFVEDAALRERLKEAKGIGTPATRAEIIHGLKAQDFLIAQGKHIVPTERGLALFGVLERADPALVDPGRDGAARVPARRGARRAQEMVGGDRRRLRPGRAHHRPPGGERCGGRRCRAATPRG